MKILDRWIAPLMFGFGIAMLVGSRCTPKPGPDGPTGPDLPNPATVMLNIPTIHFVVELEEEDESYISVQLEVQKGDGEEVVKRDSGNRDVKLPLHDLLKTLPPGTYRFRARLVYAGAYGGWSPWFYGRKDW